MSCCFHGAVLTRAERAAVARLREQRAQGRVPHAATHRAHPAPRIDPLVTFRPTPKPRRPAPKPKPRTAHQLKKERGRAVPARPHNSPRRLHAPPPPPPSASLPSAASQKAAAVPRGAGGGRQAAMKRKVAGGESETGSDSTAKGGKSGMRMPAADILGAVKAMPMWRGMRDKEETSVDGESSLSGKGELSAPSRLKGEVRRRWGDVMDKFGGGTVRGERFVIKERPETSDFPDGSDDRYFQELMSASS